MHSFYNEMYRLLTHAWLLALRANNQAWVSARAHAYTYTRMCVRTRHGLLSNPCRGFADIAITRHNSLTDPIASDAQITLRQGQGRRGLRCTLYSNRTGFLEAFHYTLPNDFVTTLCTFTTILRRQPRISREG